MSAPDSGERPPQDGFLGFRTFADDTPRPAAGAAGPAASRAQAAPAASYPAPYPVYDDLRIEPRTSYASQVEEPPARRSVWLMAAGFVALALLVAAAVALGPSALDGRRVAPSAASPSLAAPTAQQVAPAPSGAPTDARSATGSAAAPRLDSLRVASAAAEQSVRPAPRHPAAQAPTPERHAKNDPIGEALAKLLDEPLTPAARDPSQSAPPARARPSVDCRDARSYGQRMVCEDPALAAADRRMNRAYARALAAGVPADELQAEQNDWLSIREDAARRSPDAVRSIYEQRIDDLRALATDGPD